MLGPVRPTCSDRPVISTNVRGYVERGDFVTEFPFETKNFGCINIKSDSIGKHKCLTVFHEGGDDDEQATIREAIQTVAKTWADVDVHFLWAFDPTGLVQTVRDTVQLGPVDECPSMVLLDIPNGGSYFRSPTTDISADIITHFLQHPGDRQKLV